MSTISTLAVSRIKYNRSRTILTAVSIMLTTVLLTAIATSTVGLLNYNKLRVTEEGNVHASLSRLDAKQIEMLKNHMDVEAVEVSEVFATIEYGKMNGHLSYAKDLFSSIDWFSASISDLDRNSVSASRLGSRTFGASSPAI